MTIEKIGFNEQLQLIDIPDGRYKVTVLEADSGLVNGMLPDDDYFIIDISFKITTGTYDGLILSGKELFNFNYGPCLEDSILYAGGDRSQDVRELIGKSFDIEIIHRCGFLIESGKIIGIFRAINKAMKEI